MTEETAQARGIEVRPYAPGDFAGVDALWWQVFPDDPPHSRAAVAIPAKLAVQPEHLLVAVDCTGIVGTAAGGYAGRAVGSIRLRSRPAIAGAGSAGCLCALSRRG